MLRRHTPRTTNNSQKKRMNKTCIQLTAAVVNTEELVHSLNANVNWPPTANDRIVHPLCILDYQEKWTYCSQMNCENVLLNRENPLWACGWRWIHRQWWRRVFTIAFLFCFFLVSMPATTIKYIIYSLCLERWFRKSTQTRSPANFLIFPVFYILFGHNNTWYNIKIRCFVSYIINVHMNFWFIPFLLLLLLSESAQQRK